MALTNFRELDIYPPDAEPNLTKLITPKREQKIKDIGFSYFCEQLDALGYNHTQDLAKNMYADKGMRKQIESDYQRLATNNRLGSLITSFES